MEEWGLVGRGFSRKKRSGNWSTFGEIGCSSDEHKEWAEIPIIPNVWVKVQVKKENSNFPGLRKSKFLFNFQSKSRVLQTENGFLFLNLSAFPYGLNV